jgi:hypothetical protein
VLLLGAVAGPVFARGPVPALRIPLERFGYANVSSRYLLEGATMLTVDYVDQQHLLLTFGISRLMPRLPDCPSEDEDRVVRAVLLELPTGKELAHTEWRFHDLGQYLWNLGGGIFLLRQRDELTTFAPLENLARGKSFEQRFFLHFDRRIDAILVSADQELLSIETTRRKKPGEAASQQIAAGGPASASQPAAAGTPHPIALRRRDPAPEPEPEALPVEITFIRLVRHAEPSDRAQDEAPDGAGKGRKEGAGVIVPLLAGRLHTAKAVKIPLTPEGFLEAGSATRDGIVFNFQTFTGRTMDLGDFPTSCPPKPTFVSPSEFVAFGCRGSDDSVDLAGFNLRGDFIWQMNFSELHAYPSIVSAVPAGRFALSRTLTLSNVFGSETPSSSQLTGQEVRVVQMYNGKLLLRVPTSPIQRAGQNFALSPDGLSLAVIHDNPTIHGEETLHDTAIEIYDLPPIAPKDRKEIDAEAALAPPHTGAAMRFSVAEIKAALVKKPEAAAEVDVENEGESGTRQASQVDSRVVGDPIPPAGGSPAGSETGSIPASDPAPACAGLTEGGSAACPVKTEPKTQQRPAEIAPDEPRKPPTLYAPGEKPEPKQAPQ